MGYCLLETIHPYAKMKKGNDDSVVKIGCRSLGEFSKRGYKPNLAIECRANECVKTAVRRGIGVGILFRESVEDDQDLKIINVPELKTVEAKSYIIWDKHKPLTPLAQPFFNSCANGRVFVSDLPRVINLILYSLVL